MKLGLKVEVQPTKAQLHSLRQHAGNARWAFNWGLRCRLDAYAAWKAAGKPKGHKWLNAISLHRDLNILKKKPVEEDGVPWMYDTSKCAPQEALIDLDSSFGRFFKKLGAFPKFKSKSRSPRKFRLTGTIRASKKFIQVPKIGRLRIKPGDHGRLPLGKYPKVSISEKAGRWFISVVGPDAQEAPVNGGSEVGLDLGIIRLATLSDGTVIENPRAFRSEERRLLKASKEVSRKKRGSNNRAKARRALAKVHARIANIRSNALHQATTYLTKNHSRIVIEDLRVRNMSRSGGSRKRGLNRSLMDASFGEFRRQLEYKGKLYGCVIAAVPAAYTSQRCSGCGHTEKGNRESQSRFCCLSCGHSENADLNAAKNILVAGSCPETLNALWRAGKTRGEPPLATPRRLGSGKQELTISDLTSRSLTTVDHV